ncbi:hypothetical protein EB796_014862 [Bugula neritina]|uniref:Uncharacterized protein n=1 Tax=Bugula neritina TaxID=10212 RepID=A0A7J7JL13_BUGNE|nr:hypothetical protein EB796_014862 [Bugula neritina]
MTAYSTDVVDTAAAESSSDSDDTSQSSFTVSTPSDSELEKMSAVGTLRPDGKLTPTNPTAAGSTPADKTSPSDSEPFYTPVLKFTPKKGNSISIPLFNKRGGSANSQLSRKPAKKSKANNACLANFSNPSYEHVSLGSVYATRSSEGDGVTDSSVYETPEETVPSGNRSFLTHVLNHSLMC